MNPLPTAHATPRGRLTPKPAPIFAAGVYQEEDEPAEPEPVLAIDHATKRKIDSALDEIMTLRTELRGEARALRTQMSKPQRVPRELAVEMSSLRAIVDELAAAPRRGHDALASVLRQRGIEGSVTSVFSRMTARGSLSIERLHAITAAILSTSPWPPAIMAAARGARRPMIIALVGPAGVGKTTTAAKLAAHARMARKSVTLVSCDTFRVGAVDQLSKYAELMDVPCRTAATQEELLNVLASDTSDVIIVDTSGRPVRPDSAEALLGAADVRAAASTGRHFEVLLCVPASLRANDAARVNRDFAAAAPTALAITKIDETDTPAGIIHAAFETRLPISTLCNGQCVPEDIAYANEETLCELVFPVEATREAIAIASPPPPPMVLAAAAPEPQAAIEAVIAPEVLIEPPPASAPEVVELASELLVEEPSSVESSATPSIAPRPKRSRSRKAKAVSESDRATEELGVLVVDQEHAKALLGVNAEETPPQPTRTRRSRKKSAAKAAPAEVIAEIER